MNIDLTIKNYRCFSDRHPATFRVQPGLTALVGKNNAGKSSILRFLYELRGLFQRLAGDPQSYVQALNGGPRGFSMASTITDNREIFHNGNERPMTIQVSVSGCPPRHPIPDCLSFRDFCPEEHKPIHV
jgi:AAA ATPase domain